MPNIEFIKTKVIDTSDRSYSIAVFNLNGQLIEHPFWYSCINAYGKEGTIKLLTARVLYENGFMKEAHDILKPEAVGQWMQNEDGNIIDTRNWQQQWLDSNPIVQLPQIPDIDPLL